MNKLLEGVKVLDLGWYTAGPYCAKLLADAGAEVIHVERPPAGDPSRQMGPFAPPEAARPLSATFAFLNSNKRSVTLNFAHPEGAKLLQELAGWADLVVENFSPGTLARYGLGPDTLLGRQPSLVLVSISNYGQTGPYRDYRGTPLTLQAMAGLMSGNGDDAREPLRYPRHLAEYWAGANAAYSALVARWWARRTGQGQVVDVSILESIATTYWSLYAEYEYGGGLQGRGQKDLYPAADGWFMSRWQTSVPWDVYATVFDAPELAVDPELQPPLALGMNSERVASVLSERIQTRTRREWFARTQEFGIPAGMLQTLDEVRACPHLEARDFFDMAETPDGGAAVFPGAPYQVMGEPRERARRVPGLGEHNRAVYGGLLGHAEAELEALHREGAI